MTILLLRVAVLGAAVFFAACGAASDNDSREESISSSEAQALSQATVGIAGQVEAKLLAALSQKLAGLKDWISGTPEDFAIDGSIDNPNGGSATITGTGGRTPREICGGVAGTSCPDGRRCVLEDQSPDATGECVPASEWKVQVTVTFNDWAVPEADMVVNGSVDLDYEIHTAVPRSFLMVADGTVTVGPPLPVKVQLTVTAENKQLSVCGSVAGVPIDNGNCS